MIETVRIEDGQAVSGCVPGASWRWRTRLSKLPRLRL